MQVELFINRFLYGTALPEKLEPAHLRQALDSLGDGSLHEAPVVPERGLWSWGYVIYDYQRFLDNMARLRLNRLTIWNDVPPVNCREVIAYAHSRGVRLCLGFPWGWGMDYNLADPADRQKIQDQVVEHYVRHIQPQEPDGIYFQTLTEHHQLELGGRSVAALTCELVNRTAAALSSSRLAWTSASDCMPLRSARTTASFWTWTRASPLSGKMPGRCPSPTFPALEQDGISFDETLAYACELASFRQGTTFAMIAKGWTTLDWPHEFEHHETYSLGLHGRGYTRRRLELIRPRWERVNALWLQHFRQAQSFYQALLQASTSKLSVLGLVEDGLFEEAIRPSVALFAETLWDPYSAPDQLLQRSFNRFNPDTLCRV